MCCCFHGSGLTDAGYIYIWAFFFPAAFLKKFAKQNHFFFMVVIVRSLKGLGSNYFMLYKKMMTCNSLGKSVTGSAADSHSELRNCNQQKMNLKREKLQLLPVMRGRK